MAAKAYFDTLRSVASTALTGSYQTFGSAMTHAPMIVKIVNNSDADVTISINGSTDMDYVPAGTFTLYDLSKNQVGNVFFPSVQWYLKGTAGVAGSIYLIAIYGGE